MIIPVGYYSNTTVIHFIMYPELNLMFCKVLASNWQYHILQPCYIGQLVYQYHILQPCYIGQLVYQYHILQPCYIGQCNMVGTLVIITLQFDGKSYLTFVPITGMPMP